MIGVSLCFPIKSEKMNIEKLKNASIGLKLTGFVIVFVVAAFAISAFFQMRTAKEAMGVLKEKSVQHFNRGLFIQLRKTG